MSGQAQPDDPATSEGPKRTRARGGSGRSSAQAGSARAGHAPPRKQLRSAPEPGGETARVGPESLDQMRLTGDRLMVKQPDDRERRSKTGLLIPATAAASHKRCIWSDVVLVGPETRAVRSGDMVLFIPQSGTEVEVDGETYLLLRERDVQAIASERVDRHAGQYL
jgi:chaperonin GroES